MPATDGHRRHAAQGHRPEGREYVQAQLALVELSHPRSKRLAPRGQAGSEPAVCVLGQRQPSLIGRHPRALALVRERLGERSLGFGLGPERADAHPP